MTYEITYCDGAPLSGEYMIDLGQPFPTEAAAWAAVKQLRAREDDWAFERYDVREVEDDE